MAILVQFLVGCILFPRGVSPGPVVVTTILNDDVFKTGVGEYGMYPSVQALNISCDVSSSPIDGLVELLHEYDTYGEPRLVQNSRVPTGGPSQLIFTYLLPTDLPSRSRIVCSLLVSHGASLTRGSLDYVVEDPVLLNVWDDSESSRCISDIGYSGTSRESAIITCIRSSLPGDAIEFGWRGISERRQLQVGDRALVRSRVNLAGSSLGELVCIDPVLNEEICRLPRITVTDDPAVSITPAGDFVSNTEDIEFTCASDPPAQVRWLVFGDHGDILADSLGTFIVPESILGVFMTTDGSSSRLRVTGRTVPLSNIHTVMCTADVRGFFRIAVARKERSDAETMATTGGGTSQSTQGGGKGDMDTVEAGDVSPAYIIVIVILVLIVICLIVLCVLLHMRVKRATSESGTPGNSGPYAAYHPPVSGSTTYMDVNVPRAARAENDYTGTDGHGYEVPKT